jgi:hypothetical protein
LGFCSKELIVESPFTLLADNFPALSAKTQFVATIGFPLLPDSGNQHTATNLFKLQQETYCIPVIGSTVVSLFPLLADWLPVISYLQQVPQ